VEDEAMTTPDRPGPDLVATFEKISEATCWSLLSAADVGRVGLLVDGRPEILPVNYAIDGESVLFRTAEGTVLNEASMTTVAFEVDGVDESTHEGWSVLVQGFARDIGDAVGANSERIRSLSLVTWAPGDRARWFQIRADKITGRRVRLVPASL
jgi:nitroimidazol reductase NimA-like FMN-containing flavoprotein (pyridoxamine 5'-phosphate oxidase superfamily)